MSTDIRAMAYSEATTLGVAMALMAKRRNDLDAAMRQAALQQMPVESEGAAEVRAIEAITRPAATQQLLDVKV
jgi:GTP-sensing pleiotropic transcriptional regulator CodY